MHSLNWSLFLSHLQSCPRSFHQLPLSSSSSCCVSPAALHRIPPTLRGGFSASFSSVFPQAHCPPSCLPCWSDCLALRERLMAWWRSFSPFCAVSASCLTCLALSIQTPGKNRTLRSASPASSSSASCAIFFSVSFCGTFWPFFSCATQEVCREELFFFHLRSFALLLDDRCINRIKMMKAE